MQSQRKQQKDKTRKQIIEAALKQFASDGLTVARTSDIARAAKVSHGTIFLHFPTREALLSAVIEYFGTQLSQRIHELVDVKASMKELLMAHLQGIREHEAFYTRLILERRLLTESCSFVMIQSAVSFHIIQVAQREMKAGVIRIMPVDLLFNTWIGLVHHYLINGDLFSPNGSVLERYAEQLAAHFLYLIT